MNTCAKDHTEIAFNGANCPLCEQGETGLRTSKEWIDSIIERDATIRQQANQLASWERAAADWRKNKERLEKAYEDEVAAHNETERLLQPDTHDICSVANVTVIYPKGQECPACRLQRERDEARIERDEYKRRYENEAANFNATRKNFRGAIEEAVATRERAQKNQANAELELKDVKKALDEAIVAKDRAETNQGFAECDLKETKEALAKAQADAEKSLTLPGCSRCDAGHRRVYYVNNGDACPVCEVKKDRDFQATLVANWTETAMQLTNELEAARAEERELQSRIESIKATIFKV